MEWKKVDGKTKELILYLKYNKPYSKSQLAKDLNTGRPYLYRMLKKLNDLGAVDEYTLKLNKNKVKIKRFSWEIMKQFMVPVTYGIVVNFLISFAFGFDAIVFVLGGTVVFMSQLLYTLWKILKTEEIIEVYLKC